MDGVTTSLDTTIVVWYSLLTLSKQGGCPAHCRKQPRGRHWRSTRHCGAIVPHGSAAALPPQRGRSARRRHLLESESSTPLCPPNATAISYTLIRHIGLVLDELSSQGLEVWQDERRRW